MKRKIFNVLFALVLVASFSLVVAVPAAYAAATWTAYNDCSSTTGGNTTAYTVTAGSTTGLLKNYDSGANTPVTVTFSSSGSPSVETQGAYTNSGTDAYTTFYNKANMAGVIRYGSSGYWVDMTFTGMDPAKTYNFATTANRNDSGYTARISRFTLSGDDGATNASTSGVTVINDHSVYFSTGYNTVNGYVARWTGINPGSDGSFVVRVQEQTANNKGYGPSVFMLQEEATTPTIGYNPSSFTFNATPGGANPSTQSLNISNSGVGTLNWTLLDDAAWLSVSPTSGTNEGSSTLTVDITGLSLGTYNAIITISATGASNTPQTVPVTLIIAPPSPIYQSFSEAKSGYSGSTPTDVTSITVNKPSGTVDGDLLVALVSWDASSTTPSSIIVPSGWATLNLDKYSDPSGSSTYVTVGVFYKIASSEGASYTWSWTGAESVYACITRITGADTSNPINAWVVATGTQGSANTGSVTCPTITTTVTSTLVLRLFGSDRGSSSTSYPSGITGITKGSSGSGSLSGETNLGAAYTTQATAGVTGTAAFTITSTSTYSSNRAFTIAIAPGVITPTINVSGTPLSAFSGVPGTPSAEQYYTVSGSHLTEDIVISAPADFEISTTSGSGFVSSLILYQSGGSVAPTTIYVRFNRTTAGTSNGNISHTSSGAPNQNVAVSGTASYSATATFQYGASSYSGTVDTFIRGTTEGNTNFSTNTGLEWDDNSGTTTDEITLLRFTGIFSSEGGPIPNGATITSASLTYMTTDLSGSSTAEGDPANVYESLVDWPGTTVTWNNFGGEAGVQTDEYYSTLIAEAPATAKSTQYTIDVTASLQRWSSGTANYGWIFLPTGDDGVTSYSSDHATVAYHPLLTVIYTTGAVNQAPNQPVLVQPTDGAVDVSVPPILQVTVTDPDSDPMNVTFYGRQDGTGTGEDFTIVIIPDTQNEAQNVFNSQTQWIVTNKVGQNIVFTTHVGDIVNTASSTTEWDKADTAMDFLDAGNVAYSVGPGNHDQPTTNYNIYFGISRFSGKSWYGGHYGSNNDNNYSLFSAGGMDFILINLQYGSTTDILNWADALLKAYPNRRGIVEQHNILNTDNSWQNQAPYTALKDNPNLFLMLCGHMHTASDGAAYRAELGDDGHTIHIMLADYQDFNGGDGWLRILRFSPADDKIYATTYSPYTGGYLTTSPDRMEMTYDMAGTAAFEVIGTVNSVASGSNAFITWPSLDPNTEYEWYVDVTDGSATTTGLAWSFTTNEEDTPTVTFDLGGHGTLISGDLVQTVAYHGDATAPTFSVEDGWNFTGWDNAFTNVTADITVTAQYTAVAPTVTFDLGGHGTLTSGDLVQIVAYHGEATAPTFDVEAGWNFTGWDNAFTNVMADITVTAQYTAVAPTVTFNLGGHGTLTSGDLVQIVAYHGEATAPTFSVAAGWNFTGWDNAFTNVTADITVTATFAIDSYTITVNAGTHGGISPATGSVNDGATPAYTITADAGYHIDEVTVDGVSVKGSLVGNVYTFPTVHADHTLAATFAIDSYTITVNAGSNGGISPATGLVSDGATPAYTITADAGYHIDEVTVDGVSVKGSLVGNVYTFPTVHAGHTLAATFSIDTQKKNTTTTVRSSNNPSTYGQSIRFTATVSTGMQSSVKPTGTITFKDGETILGIGTINSQGQATYNTNSLSIGIHPIKAIYSGDNKFNGSTSSPLSQRVNKASTSTKITSSKNPSVYGQSVTFTVTVSPGASGLGTPTGTVTLKDGAKTLGTMSLNGSGKATFTITSLSVGLHLITATYDGDSNFSGSISFTLQMINRK